MHLCIPLKQIYPLPTLPPLRGAQKKHPFGCFLDGIHYWNKPSICSCIFLSRDIKTAPRLFILPDSAIKSQLKVETFPHFLQVQANWYVCTTVKSRSPLSFVAPELLRCFTKVLSTFSTENFSPQLGHNTRCSLRLSSFAFA